MASYCKPRGHSGVLSMRKPAGQSAFPSKCASSFRFEFVASVFRLSPARGERIKVRGSTPCRRYLNE